VVLALDAASFPEIVRTMVDTDFLQHRASVVSNLGVQERWILGLKFCTSD